MKLAEALLERKSLLEKLNNFTYTLVPSLSHEEGEEQDSDYVQLSGEFQSTLTTYTDLITQINRTNNATTITFRGKNVSLMEAIALKEGLNIFKNAYTSLAHHRGGKRVSYGQENVKIIVDVAPKVIKQRLDQAERDLRELDILIQSANWTTELV